MNPQEEIDIINWYSKNVILIIKKWENTYSAKVSFSTYKNNELQIEISWVSDERNNILFDSNVEIISLFSFNNINQDLLGILLLIYGIKKYFPKTINLVLPYFPYTAKDMLLNEKENNKLQISTDNWLLTLLQNSWISTIKTFDLWNKYVQNYSSIYIENITKDKIFVDEFDFFLRTNKKVSIILLNQDDYWLFKRVLWDKENINLIHLDEEISTKSKTEQINILSSISEWWKSIIYIFEKSIIRWNKIAALINMIGNNIDVKELNLCITHGIFAQWSYRKYNSLLEKFPFLYITTTNSIYSYINKIDPNKVNIIKLPLVKQKKIVKDNIKKTEVKNDININETENQEKM